MSKLEEILEDLTKYIKQQGKYTRIYFDDSLMDPNNTALPALSFKVGEMEQETPSSCNEYVKELEIRRHTDTLSKKKLFTELWDFEEYIIKLIKDGNTTGALVTRHDVELEYLKTYQIGALVYRQHKNKSDKEVFFSNILRVAFKLRFEI